MWVYDDFGGGMETVEAAVSWISYLAGKGELEQSEELSTALHRLQTAANDLEGIKNLLEKG